MKKLTKQDKKRFQFDSNDPFNSTEVRIKITDKLSPIEKEVVFFSIRLMTAESVESILKEHIELIRAEAREVKLNKLLK